MLNLQLEKDPDEEIIIQWWRKEDAEYIHDEIDSEIWKMMVELWDNEPLTADGAGLMDIFKDARERVNERKRQERAKKLQIIQGGVNVSSKL